MNKEQFSSERQESLSESERKAVESIERLPMSDTDKLDVLLTWCGEKLATDTRIIFEKWHKGENPPEISDDEKQKIIADAKSALSAMGLFSVGSKDIEREPYVENEGSDHPVNFLGGKGMEFYVSPSKETAEKLQKLWDGNDEVKDAREMGEIYGFPPTAVEAYGQFFEQGFHKGFQNREMTIEQEELPKEIQDQDYMAFAQFRLSKNNWREELKTAERWAKKVKELDPALYEKTVNYYKQDKHTEFQKTFDELREKTHAEMEQKVKERLEKNPLPTDEEVLIGAYLEELEPQVRDAIRVFYKKGYATESSGFAEREGKELQDIDGYFEIDQETEKKLKELGVEVRNFRRDYGWVDDVNSIQFEPQVADVSELKKKWDAIADILPDRKKFAYGLTGSQLWEDRNDIQKYFLERRLALKAYDPKDEASLRKEIQELSQILELRPDLVEQVEKFPSLADEDKANLFLVATHFKQAGIIGPPPQSVSRGEYSEEKFQQNLKELEALCNQMGLSWKTRDLNAEHEGELLVRAAGVYVSRDEKTIEELFEKFGNDHKRVGELLGYPPTATANYEHDVPPPEIDFPDEVKYSPAMEFRGFQMTSEHWQEEFKTVEKWARAIQRIDPELYRRMTSVSDKVEKLRTEDPERFREMLNSEDAMKLVWNRDPYLYHDLVKEKGRLSAQS